MQGANVRATFYFGGARDEFRLERFVVVFEGESEKLRVVGRVREAIGAFFFLQKRAQRLIGLDERCADLRIEIQLSIFLLRFDVSFQEISIVADASEWRASVVEAFEAAQCE